MQVLLIKDLKTFGMSLEEIKCMIQTEDIAYMEGELKKKVQILEEEVENLKKKLLATKFTYERLRNGSKILQSATREVKPKDKYKKEYQRYIVEASISSQPMWVLYTRYESDLNADNLFLDRVLELQGMRDKYGLFHCGPFMAIFHEGFASQFIKEKGDLEVFLPVLEPKNTNIKELKLFDIGLCASTIHVGHYKDAIRAYLTLQEWIEKNEYLITGPPIEWYLLDSSCTTVSDHYVTRISFPVKKVE